MVMLLLFCMAASSSASVLSGIDILQQRHFDLIQGKRIGLITNHTGRDANGESSIDVLYHAPGVRVVALFSPEHGLRGVEDAEVSSGVDGKTGLPVFSLYGATCRPTPDMLRGMDMLVFDIQGIGTRFYTYIGTLSLAMRAAKSAGIPLVVLDRPNPINGTDVGGAIPHMVVPEKKSGCGALTSIHAIPTRHGMTVAELAGMFNTEFGIGADLTVVPMEGWHRAMYYDETGLVWHNPSPNMKSLSAALLYPGLGILESTNLSVGRGTDHPFEQYGAPWVDAVALVANLEKRKIPGVQFSPVSFVPMAVGHPYHNKTCYGVAVTIVNRHSIDPILIGLHLVQAFFAVHTQRFRRENGFAQEVGDGEVWRQLTRSGVRPEDVVSRWQKDLDVFAPIRSRYLLYR